jgi:hypothetical protein
MVSSGMLRHVALVRTDVSEEPDSSIRVTRIGELGTTQAATSKRSVRRLLVAACVVPSSPILVTLMKEAPGSSETSVLTRTIRRNIPDDTIQLSRLFGPLNPVGLREMQVAIIAKQKPLKTLVPVIYRRCGRNCFMLL